MMNINWKINSPHELVSVYARLLHESLPHKFTSMPTDSELEVLSHLTLLPQQYSLARFSTPAKTQVLKAIPSLSRANMNSKIYSLIDRGYITRDEDMVMYIDKTYLKGAMMLLYKLYPHNRYLTNYEAQKLGIDFITTKQDELEAQQETEEKRSYSLCFTFTTGD